MNEEMYDYIITKPPLNEETLAHYGVMGMKWGIRKDLRRTGKISKKTKGKIKKAVSKASYSKMRRMLNGAEDLRSDYIGKNEFAKSSMTGANAISNKGTSKYYSDKAKKANKNLKEVTKNSKYLYNESKKKGYKYNSRKQQKLTQAGRLFVGTGYAVAGIPGAGLAYAGTHAVNNSYNNLHGSKDSPYITSTTNHYKKKKRSER